MRKVGSSGLHTIHMATWREKTEGMRSPISFLIDCQRCLSWCRFIQVSKVHCNFHTFYLVSFRMTPSRFFCAKYLFSKFILLTIMEGRFPKAYHALLLVLIYSSTNHPPFPATGTFIESWTYFYQCYSLISTSHQESMLCKINLKTAYLLKTNIQFRLKAPHTFWVERCWISNGKKQERSFQTTL